MLVSLSVPPAQPSQAAPTNSLPVQETAPTRSSDSPLTISLTLGSATNQTAIVGLSLDSPVPFDDINLQLGVTPGLSLLSSNVPTRTIVAAGQQLTFQAEIAGNVVEPQEVVVLAWGTHDHRTFNEVATLRVTAVNGQLAETVEPIDTLLPSPAQIVETSPESGTSTPSAASASMTVSGQFNYNDHVTRPMTTTVSPDPQGLDPISTIRPIRKARVQIQYRFTSDLWWSTLAESTYTDDTGSFVLSVPMPADSTATPFLVRARVCTLGPEEGDLLKLTGGSGVGTGGHHCLTSDESMPSSTFSVVAPPAADTRLDSAPWNIYDVALESFEYLTTTVGKPTAELPIHWTKDYEWPITPGVSSYLGSVVRINGTLENGDQWNDSVIAHEVGHWVMHHYSDFPYGYIGPHAICQEGNPGLQYSEAWANFFMAASRTASRDLNNRKWAAYYIDAFDNNPSSIGPSTSKGISRAIETSNIVDGTRPAEERWRRGNFCEWQITAALWDVFDPSSSISSVSEGWDNIERPFADIFTAFSSQIPRTNGAQYPQNINDWWYTWTNTLGSRPSQPSLGYEQDVLAILEHHEIGVGVQIQLAWSEPSLDFDAHLWLPSSSPGHIFYEQRGAKLVTPFTTLNQDVTTSSMTETIHIVKPVPGQYQYSVYNWSGQNSDNSASNIWTTSATVRLFNGASEPLSIGSAYGYALPPDNGHWWSVLQLDELDDSEVLNQRWLQAPSTYAQTAGSGIGKPCTGPHYKDLYEANNTLSQANAYDPSRPTRAFCLAGDQDLIKLVVTESSTYRIETINLAAGVDTVLDLYAADGTTQIASINDGGITAGASLLQRQLVPGTYYVRAREFQSRGGAALTYDLSITQNPSTLCPLVDRTALKPTIADSQYKNNAPLFAIDADPASYWGGGVRGSGWIGVLFGDAPARAERIRFAINTDGGYSPIKDYDIQFSNDATIWTTVASGTVPPGSGDGYVEEKVWTALEQPAYYWRLNIRSVYGSYEPSVQDLQLFTPPCDTPEAPTNLSTAALLLNDTFNTENSGVARNNYATFTNWLVSDGTVDLIGNGTYDFHPGNGLYVDLDGSTGNAGKLTSRTSFALAPGVYRLQFDLSSYLGSNRMSVSMGGRYIETFWRAPGSGLQAVARTIVVPSSTSGTLTFDHFGGDNGGFIIDDVELTYRAYLPDLPPAP